MRLRPMDAAPRPSYPPRGQRAPRPGRLRRLGAWLSAAIALGGAPAELSAEQTAPAPVATEARPPRGDESEPDWMVWLEDFGFCPSMDCDPRPRTPRVRVAGAMVSGSLSSGTIRRYVRAQRNRFRGCYESELRRHPDLEGRVAVLFLVSSEGEVVHAKVESATFEAPALEACVVETFSSIAFPAVDGGGAYVVTYPLTFHRRPP